MFSVDIFKINAVLVGKIEPSENIQIRTKKKNEILDILREISYYIYIGKYCRIHKILLIP